MTKTISICCWCEKEGEGAFREMIDTDMNKCSVFFCARCTKGLDECNKLLKQENNKTLRP